MQSKQRQISCLMDLIPQEILFNIFTRLPTKSIGLCRCVSRPWRQFLNELVFIRAHLERTKQFANNELLIVKPGRCNTVFSAKISNHLFGIAFLLATDLTYVVDSDFWRYYVPSCDGLIITEDDTKRRWLTNPTTKDSRVLPNPSHPVAVLDESPLHGLGYDHVSDDYKVVRISVHSTRDDHGKLCSEMFVHLYSLRNGTWKQVESSPHEQDVYLATSGVFVSGAIHWTADKQSSGCLHIIGFDLNEEKFREVPPPSSVSEVEHSFLDVLGGCLCLLNGMSKKEHDIWVMKQYGVKESWTKILIVTDGVSNYRPLSCVPEQGKVVMAEFGETLWRTLMYDLDSATFRNIRCNMPGTLSFGSSLWETLVSPYYNYGTQRG